MWSGGSGTVEQNVGQRQVSEEEGNGTQAGGQHPRMSNQSMILPGFGYHVAPTGYGFADAEAEERERHFGQDVARNERSEEHTSELQSLRHLVCRLLLEKKKTYR